ncbi:MAG: HEAT repeat domain-containing protein [Phycisphaerales bacterium]|nr:MAG: HEAT repeat domain-containing protein [Phycisphaerales bacterium]
MILLKRHVTCCVLLIAVAASTVVVGQDRAAADAKQRELIAVLQSDAPKADKAIACKRLAIYGTEEAVPALAPLLADMELASWARIPLEVIPGSAPDAAFRNALASLQGRLLIGTINSIGVRRDAQAIDALTQKLSAADADVASAAAVALGHIGGDRAAKALEQALGQAPANVRSAVAIGCILCAEKYLADGKSAEAVTLYDEVRQADIPNQRHLEAIRGAILARQSDGIPLLIEQLESADKERLGIGLRAARELPGRDVTEALAAELNRLDANRRPLLLLALADRHDAAVLPAVLKAARSGSKDLRITAIGILIRLGDVSCVPALLEAATTGDAELEAAAAETLVRLPDKKVDADLLGRLPQAKGKMRQTLIELAGQRQISAALPALVSSLQDSDAGIRGAAVEAVGILGHEQQAADLVKLLQKTTASKERASIEKALLAVSGRCGVTCIPHLLPLTQSRDNALHMIGLHALAIVGGPDALAEVKSAMESPDSAIQNEAVRILSTWPNNWPEDAEAGQTLLALARSNAKLSHKVLGLRGYLQYVRGNGKLSNEDKVARIKDLLSEIERPEEERLAIAVLGGIPTTGALEMLVRFAQDPTVAEEAYSAIVNLTGRNRRGLPKQQCRQALQTVLEKSENDGTKRRARQTLDRIR